MGEALTFLTWVTIITWQGYEFWVTLVRRHVLAREVNAWLAAS